MTSDRVRTARSPFSWQSASASHVGHVRSVNEDAVCARPDAGLWAVADGLGGHSAGDLASGTVVDTLQRLKPYPELSLMVEFMEHSLLEANQSLVKLSAERQQVIGSTVVVFTIVERHGVFMWVGDSRLYRYRGGVLRQMTTDHSQQERFIAEGVMTPDEAKSHPHGHLLTRAVGAHDDLLLDLDVCLLRGGDIFLLCSDGLDKHVTQDEIAVHLARGDPSQSVDSLLALVLGRGASDNVSLCVVRIK